jgi:hypothetical protein
MQMKNLEWDREVKRYVSNGEIQRDLTTYLFCADPYLQSQQWHKIDKFYNKARYFVKYYLITET